MTRMHWMVRAPVLSATLRRVWGWITRRPPAASAGVRCLGRSARAVTARMGGRVDRLGGRGLLDDDVRGPAVSPARWLTSTRRQRFVADSGPRLLDEHGVADVGLVAPRRGP